MRLSGTGLKCVRRYVGVAQRFDGRRGKKCILEFDQFAQSYRLPCAVSELKTGDAAREAAVWHNRLFNRALPETVQVLAFQPDWASAGANPGPHGRRS